MADDDFQQRIQRVEQDGRARFGDDGWTDALAAIGRSAGASGIPENAMREIVARPDAAQVLFGTGRELLLNESDAGSKEAEHAYARIRQREREAHRRLKGR